MRFTKIRKHKQIKRILGGIFVLAATMQLTACGDELFNRIAFAPAKTLPADANHCEYYQRHSELCNSVESEEVFYPSLDEEIKLQALYFPNRESDKIVIYLHGNAGHVYWRVSQMVKLSEIANALIVSYRGYGKSNGRPTEVGVYQDVRATLRYAREVLGFEPQNIYLHGHSLGAAIAIEVAQDTPLGGLILISPFLSGRAMAEHRNLAWVPGLNHPFDSVSKVKKLTDTPALFIHGTADTIIPIEQGYMLFESYASQRKSFKRVEGLGHSFIARRIGDVYWGWLREFVMATSQPL